MLDPTRWDLTSRYIHILVMRDFNLFAEPLTWNIWLGKVDQI